jgi:hypothetical protein
LRTAIQRVRAFACLDLDKYPDQLKALRGREARESFPLRLNAQGARSHSPDHAARPRRRGDRVMKRRDFITLLDGASAL